MALQTELMTYDDALGLFLQTRGTYGGGLSNHGPMATEALDHMGADQWIGPFVADYRPRLNEREREVTSRRGGDWRSMLAEQLPEVVAAAAAGAGHDLLRAAHAVRGIERAEATGTVPDVRIDELRVALHRWKAGRGLPVPAELVGDHSIDAWSTALTPLATFEPADGLLTVSLAMAAEQPGYVEAVRSLRRCDDAKDTLDMLAMRALEGYASNADFLSRFTLLHGVTVTTMARVLVDHLDEAGQRQLEAAAAGFVAAAAIAFDRRLDAPDVPTVIGTDIAGRAGATLDDHTIKFTDACLGLAERTGSELPLRAAELQIQLT